MFWILFTVVNMAAMEWLDFTGGGYTHKVYKRGRAPKENTNESEKEAQLLVQQATDSMSKTLTLVNSSTNCWSLTEPNVERRMFHVERREIHSASQRRRQTAAR